MQEWKTLARETILDHSKYLRVENHTVELPNGRVIANWPWVIMPDYVNVVVEDEKGEFLCFRQTKYAISGTSLAPVGGYIEPGEEPVAAAKRELREEMGCEAPEWIDLGHYVVGANRGVGTGYLYLARRAKVVAAPNSDDLEEQELVRLTRAQIEAALDGGEFKILAWAAAVALALRHIGP